MIKVEPKMSWPSLGDRQKNPQDAEDFVRAFESICKMANNARGMNMMNEEHAPKVYQNINSRILMFTETPGERQIRVRAEWEELEKPKQYSCLDFEARWEKCHRNMRKAGLIRTPEEDFVDYVTKIREQYNMIIRHDKRYYAGSTRK